MNQHPTSRTIQRRCNEVKKPLPIFPLGYPTLLSTLFSTFTHPAAPLPSILPPPSPLPAGAACRAPAGAVACLRGDPLPAHLHHSQGGVRSARGEGGEECKRGRSAEECKGGRGGMITRPFNIPILALSNAPPS